MTDLRYALIQLSRCTSGLRQTMLPREAQALLDERDALRKVCARNLVILEYVAAQSWDSDEIDVAMLRREVDITRAILEDPLL